AGATARARIASAPFYDVEKRGVHKKKTLRSGQRNVQPQEAPAAPDHPGDAARHRELRSPYDVVERDDFATVDAEHAARAVLLALRLPRDVLAVRREPWRPHGAVLPRDGPAVDVDGPGLPRRAVGHGVGDVRVVVGERRVARVRIGTVGATVHDEPPVRFLSALGQEAG